MCEVRVRGSVSAAVDICGSSRFVVVEFSSAIEGSTKYKDQYQYKYKINFYLLCGDA